MSTRNFIEVLASVLPRKDISKVLNGLRQNSILWEALGNEEFADTLINWDGSDQIDFWNPSNLAIIRTTMGDGIASNKATSLNEIIENNSGMVQNFFENQLQDPKVPENFLDVAYYSIGLVQKYKQTSSWQSAFKSVFSASTYSENSFIKIWGPVIICLYGMVDDFLPISNILFDHFPFSATLILIHKTYLCNQVTEISACSFIKSYIKELSIIDQYRTIRQLSLMGYKESAYILSRIAANNIILIDPNVCFYKSNGVENLDNYGLQKANLIELICGVLGNNDLFDKLQDISDINEYSEKNEIFSPKLFYENPIERELHSVPVSISPDCDTPEREILATDNSKILSSFHKEMNFENPIIPFRKIFEAEKHWKASNSSDVQSLAKKTVERIINQSSELFFEEIDDSIYELDLIKPLDCLINLDMIEEASLLANYLVEIFPNNQELLFEASKIFDLLNMQELSLSYAILGAYCNPGSFMGNRYLAEFYESKGLWEYSYLERNFIVENDIHSSIDDFLALAHSALANNKYDVVIGTGKYVFEIFPNNGISYWLVGEALSYKGDFDLAISYLNRATLLLENDERPWKSLINAYRFTNNQQLLYKTINNATRLIPDSCSLKLSQAQYYIDNENIEEGHKLLGDARRLKTTGPSTVLELGKLYEETGDLKESKEVYMDGFHRWPLITDFPLRLGKLLMEQNNYVEAETILNDFLTSNPNDLDTWILYLKSQMGDIHASLIGYVFNQSESGLSLTEKIHPTCERILISRPDDPLFNLLMAEILLIKSRTEEALDIYRNINKSQYQFSGEELWRMKAGYGKAELDCLNTEAAIAILIEAVTEKPDYFDTTRILAEAYIKASLDENALELGLEFIERNGDDPKVFDWYFGIIKEIPDKRMGANYIDKALKLVRTNPDIYVSLASMHLQNNLVDEAEYVLVNYLNQDELTIPQLQNAAFLFYKLDKLDYGWQFINTGIRKKSNNNLELLSDAVGILINQGNYLEALKYLDEIIEIRPEEIYAITLKSDLLAESGDLSGAIDNITTALNLLLKRKSRGAGFSDDFHFKYLTPAWNKSLENISEIFMRIIFLNRKLGNLENAFDLAKESVELIPNHLPTRYRAVELAFELLDFQQALEWASYVDEYREPEIIDNSHEDLGEYLEALVGIYIFLCEYELSSGQFTIAEHRLNQLISIDQTDPRIRSLIVRFKIRDGERIKANQELQKIIDDNQSVEYYLRENQIIGNNFEQYRINSQIHSLIDTALELYHWDIAYQLANLDLDSSPSSPLRHFFILKVIAHSLEKLALCSDLQCKNLMGSLEKLLENCMEKANTSLAFIENNSKMPGNLLETLRLVLVLLNKSTGEIGDSNKCLEIINEDILLSSIYRKLGIYDALSRLVNYQETQVDVLINAAFGLSRTNLESGYQLAKVCINIDPDNPFGQAVFSKICEELGSFKEAYESIKMALIYYPEEPNWHFNAARLAEKLNRNEESIYHYQKSLNYLPDNATIYLNLGQAYLENNQPALAIEVFEKCSNEITDNYQLNLGFAKAYALLGNYGRANMYIKKSIEMAPNYSEPLWVGATMAYDSGHLLEARDLAERMYTQHPDDIEIILAYCKLQEKLDSPELAVRVLHDAMTRFEYIPIEIVLKCGELVYRMEGPLQAMDVLGKKKDQFSTKPEFLGAYSKYHFEGGFIQQAELYAYEALKFKSLFARDK